MKTVRNLKYVCLKYVSSKRVSRTIENTNTKTSQKYFFCKSIQNKSRTVSSFIVYVCVCVCVCVCVYVFTVKWHCFQTVVNFGIFQTFCGKKRKGGGLPCPFWNLNKSALILEKKCPDYAHLWIKCPSLFQFKMLSLEYLGEKTPNFFPVEPFFNVM